jgi:hypothetical protein
MNSVQQFTLNESGQQQFIPNAVENSTSLQVNYVISGTTLTFSAAVMGILNATGETTVLDTYTGNASTTRTISLSQTFDAFLIVATWQESGVSALVTVTSIGPGPTVSPGFTLPMTGVGSPAGVVAAPVGSIYLNLSGGSSTTLWVKESGGSTTSGWTGK